MAKENRKDSIFKAAIVCFNKNGYFKCSMDLIADRAKITKRGLYYHFKSKDQLFVELFHHVNKLYVEQIPSKFSEKKDPEEQLRMIVHIAREVWSDNQEFLKFSQEFMSIGVRKPKIRKVMTAAYKLQVEQVKKIIVEGIDSGVFRKVDADAMARAIVLTTIGVFTGYFSLDSDFDYIKQHAFDIDFVINGLKKSSS